MNGEMVVFLFPFAVLGMWKLMTLLKEKWLIKKGFFRVIFRMPNHRKIIKFLKPDRDSIKHRGNIYPFDDDAGFIYYNSSTPEIEYDIHGNQINFLKKDLTATLDPKALDSLGIRTYNLGKKHGKRNESLMLILAIVAAALSGLTAILVLGLYDVIPVA